MKEIRIWIAAIAAKLGHRAEQYGHATYLAMVGIEGHGSYKWAALVLLALVILNIVGDVSE